MKPGDVVLIGLPRTGSIAAKLRPALHLCMLPGIYQNVLLCGISTQLHLLEEDWDELIQRPDADFANSGLHRASGVRLSYLYAADPGEIVGPIGRIATERLTRLRARLGNLLLQTAPS